MDGPDHQEFLATLLEGQKVEVVVAVHLLLRGISVRLDPRRDNLSPNPESAGRYADDADIIAAGQCVEVKSSSYRFTSPEDWPFPWGAYVNSKRRWESRAIKPFAFVLVSRPTGAMLAVSGQHRDKWYVRTSYDSRRNNWPTDNLCAPVELLRPFDELVAALLAIEGQRLVAA